MRVRVAIIDRQRLTCRVEGFWIRLKRFYIGVRQPKPILGDPGPGAREFRFLFQSALKEIGTFSQIFLAALVREIKTLQIKIVGFGVLLRAPRRRGREFDFERIDNFSRDFVLHREDALHLLLDLARPNLESVACIDQLRGNANAIAVATQTAFKEIRDIQLLPDLVRLGVFAFEREGRGPRDHAQTLDLRQRIENFLADAVAKIFLIAHLAKIDKWQNGDALLRRRRGWQDNGFRHSPVKNKNSGKRGDYECEDGGDGSAAQPNYFARSRQSFLACAFQLCRQFGVADLVSIEIHQRDLLAVFHFAIAELVKMRVPARQRREIVGDAARQQNVTSVAAAHHALGDVDPRAGNVRLLVDIDDAIDRAAVNAHPQFYFRMALQRRADLLRAFDRRFRIVEKHQRHSIAGRQAYQFSGGIRHGKPSGVTDDARQLRHQFALRVDEQFRIADHVQVEDVRDLQLRIGFGIGGHRSNLEATDTRKQLQMPRKIDNQHLRLLYNEAPPTAKSRQGRAIVLVIDVNS